MHKSLISILQDIQNKHKYLPEKELKRISKENNVSLAHIYGVATFYAQFRLKPMGTHTIKVCRGTACHVMNSLFLYEKIKNILKISNDEDTTKDLLFTVQEVACLGCCSLAPAIMIDGKVYGKVTENKVKEILDEYKK